MTPEETALALEKVVKEMADGYRWNWCDMSNHRNAANAFLGVLAREGLIEEREHPHGGLVWRVNGRLFGRTDNVTQAVFNKPRPKL